MSRTFTADRPGPLTLDLDIGLGEVHVVTENREFAELTLEPTTLDDAIARDLIDRATKSTNARTLGLVVPRPAGPSSARQVVQAGHINGMVVSSADGIVVNGQSVGTAPSAGAVMVTARLPRCSSVAMRTNTADLLTTGTLSRVAYRSESGSLTVDLAATVEAQTVSGSLNIADAATTQATSTSGSVQIDDVKHITVRTVSGAVDIAALRGTGQVESVSGTIRAHASADSELTASTVSGDIRLTAAHRVAFAPKTSSVSGRIRQPSTQRWTA